jgi:hypothetical protein
LQNNIKRAIIQSQARETRETQDGQTGSPEALQISGSSQTEALRKSAGRYQRHGTAYNVPEKIGLSKAGLNQTKSE